MTTNVKGAISQFLLSFFALKRHVNPCFPNLSGLERDKVMKLGRMIVFCRTIKEIQLFSENFSEIFC